MTDQETKRVIATTSHDMILAVRDKFRSVPADRFSWWLDLEIERVAGLPGQVQQEDGV